jgi:putative PIN family toxin of toxin-antitoxin system
MRVVVDTNVLVSAALKDRSPPALAVHLVGQRGNLLKSSTTERQLFEVLDRPYFAALIAPAARDWLTKLLAAAEMVTVTERIAACRDPTDDRFLELAVNGRGDLIVSGDGDLLVLSPFRSIPIVSPTTFLQLATR